MVLGIGGWRLLDAIAENADDAVSVCHLNEGHAAFVILERIRHCMETTGLSFNEALWMTRAGNIFTTHTPLEAGFDTFPPQFIDKYFPVFHDFLSRTGLSLQQLLALGRKNADDPTEAFNMAYLAMRGCARSNGVSRLHGTVSRHLLPPLPSLADSRSAGQTCNQWHTRTLMGLTLGRSLMIRPYGNCALMNEKISSITHAHDWPCKWDRWALHRNR